MTKPATPNLLELALKANQYLKDHPEVQERIAAVTAQLREKSKEAAEKVDSNPEEIESVKVIKRDPTEGPTIIDKRHSADLVAPGDFPGTPSWDDFQRLVSKVDTLIDAFNRHNHHLSFSHEYVTDTPNQTIE